MLVERHLYTLRRESLPVLPRGATPLRVLLLSDLHLAPWQDNKIAWLRSLAELKPDMVVLTGDLMGHVDAREVLRFALAPLSNFPGVFVHGSNDYYGPIFKNPLKYLQAPSRLSTRDQDIDNFALTDMLERELGFINVNNSATDLEARGQRVRFFGLGDPHIHYDDADTMRAELAPLDQTGPAASSRVGVVHAPYREALDALLHEQADIMLAGHTHGGQVRVPGLGALTSNCDLPPAKARGLSVWHSRSRAAFLYVSAGIGHSIYAPVRFACRPEATILTLTGE